MHILKKLFIILALFLITSSNSNVFAVEIPEDTARKVAENFLKHYVNTYGSWADSNSPSISGIELVYHENTAVVFNVRVTPKGHLLVARHDEFNPVLLYSDTSNFIPSRVNEKRSIESWIIPEISTNLKNIRLKMASPGTMKSLSYAETGVAKAWDFFKATNDLTKKTAGSDFKNATIGPLLSTTWDQGDDNTSPYTYNLYTPAGTGSAGLCSHTLTGCVATAWAQMMKYWNWPDVGSGSHSYTWNGQTLSANFSHAYDWANMPNQLTASSSTAQIQAVARLISDVGIAVDMDYGCSSVGGSGSNKYANDVSILPTFFKYKTGMSKISRGTYTAPQWFNLFKTEFDASPARPVILAIFSTSGGGHEIVVDGYQTGTTNYVHVNMGWDGNYNGYYDLTNNFTTGTLVWDANTQVIVTGIQPAYTPTLTTTAVSAITGSTAISGGNITSSISAVTARGICWSTTSNPTTSSTCTSNGTGTGSFNSSITGLSSDTLYYVRAFATNTDGTSYGNEVTFTTLNKPTVRTKIPVASVTPTSAVCGGKIVSQGGAAVAVSGVCWKTSTGATVGIDSCTTDGSLSNSFISTMTGLSTGTKYYVRAYATSSIGTGYGAETTFVTGKKPGSFILYAPK